MSFDFGAFNDYGSLKLVAIRPPQAAFQSDQRIDREWQALNYHARPDLTKALAEYQVVEQLLTGAGATLIRLEDDPSLTMDSIYTRDALVVTPSGLVRPVMGKAARRAETRVNSATLEKLGIPVAGDITGDGLLEGGDMVWLDRHTCLVGIGYRTNVEGARQLQAIMGNDVTVHWFDMPHHKGRSDVFHLMSFLSPIAADLAVVYLPLMPARLVEFLEARGMGFVHVPDEEFHSMGCNVLALAPRHVMMVSGNPETERRLRAAGVKVEVIDGAEICRKGEGGPTCMTRPLVRA